MPCHLSPNLLSYRAVSHEALASLIFFMRHWDIHIEVDHNNACDECCRDRAGRRCYCYFHRILWYSDVPGYDGQDKGQGSELPLYVSVSSRLVTRVITVDNDHLD